MHEAEEWIATYNFRPSAIAKGLSDTHIGVFWMLAADIRNSFYAMLVGEQTQIYCEAL
jgi:DNA-binding LacI/PurR family transcriptional regulator